MKKLLYILLCLTLFSCEKVEVLKESKYVSIESDRIVIEDDMDILYHNRLDVEKHFELAKEEFIQKATQIEENNGLIDNLYHELIIYRGYVLILSKLDLSDGFDPTSFIAENKLVMSYWIYNVMFPSYDYIYPQYKIFDELSNEINYLDNARINRDSFISSYDADFLNSNEKYIEDIYNYQFILISAYKNTKAIEFYYKYFHNKNIGNKVLNKAIFDYLRIKLGNSNNWWYGYDPKNDLTLEECYDALKDSKYSKFIK